MAMTSSRPYIVRALYEWILENECTPHVLVNAMQDDVLVPQQYVKNGQIVLNISPSAVMELLITNDAVQFNGRFAGVPMDIYVPIDAVLGIYARENGQGMIFELDGGPDLDPTPGGDGPPEKKKSPKSEKSKKTEKPSLRVVK